MGALIQLTSIQARDLRAGDVLLRNRGRSARRVVEAITERPHGYVRCRTRDLDARGRRREELIDGRACCYVERYPQLHGPDLAA